jgi:hypothetical protein
LGSLKGLQIRALEPVKKSNPGRTKFAILFLNPAGLNRKHTDSLVTIVQESIPPAYVAWRAGTSNRVVVPARQAGNGFLGSLKGLQIRALEPVKQRQPCIDKKENQFFLKCKEIQSGAVA